MNLAPLAPNISLGDAPTISSNLSPIEVCQIVGEWYSAHSSETRLHNAGQFFTPPIIARYMTNVAGQLHSEARILDPGAGVGILACAICEAAIAYKLTTLSIVAYESDYFKVNQVDIRAKRVKDIAQGRTNMYTMFMSLAASSLRVGGHFVSITPRSFASGAYFRHFRQQFFGMISPELIHVFDSRRSAFEDANVLQENIILAGVRKGLASANSPTVTISQSQG